MAQQPSPKTHRELSDEFMMMIGNCITQWASIEDTLCEICFACLGCPRERAAIVYYRTPTIDARLSLVDELVKSVLPKRARRSGGHDHPDLKFWKLAEKEFRDILLTRNRIAHHPTVPRFDVIVAGQESPVSYSWFEVYVSQNERLRERSADLQPLLIDDLCAHLVLTSGVREILQRFQYEKLPAHIGASAAPIPRPSLANV